VYESYFGLIERPFSIAPDPHYLYMSTGHKEAMAHLSYGLSQGGCFIVLTGEVGTGKTTLCRNLLSDLPNNVDVALILNADLNKLELLQTICDELKIDYQDSYSQKRLLDAINDYLLNTFAENRHTVLIIDEAQLLKRNVLEQIRLLTNLETNTSKLLQIILIGQPELYDLLSRNDLRQLAQRVTARYHLGGLKRNEIQEYVNYRLGVAGGKKPLFSRKALTTLYRLTNGIPRKINVLADHALLAIYSKNKTLIDAKTVYDSSTEVFIKTKSQADKSQNMWRWVAGFLSVVLISMVAWWYLADPRREHDVAVQSQSQNNEKTTISNADSGSLIPSVVEPVQDAGVLVFESNGGAEQAGSTVVSDQLLTADPNSIPDSVENALQAAGVSIENRSLDTDDFLLSIPEQDQLIQSNTFDEDTTFGRVLEASADLTGRISAFRRLATRWKTLLPSQLIESPCQILLSKEVHCLSFNKWSDLQILNRPAIMVVEHQQQLHRVIIDSIDGDQATVLIGDSVHSVALSEIQQRWNNAGLIFWQPGDVGKKLRKQGNVSDTIRAIRLHLNRALSRAQLPLLDTIASSEFDQNMFQRVVLLQQSFGLSSDGQIGEHTYLLMNELVKPELTPVLTKRGT